MKFLPLLFFLFASGLSAQVQCVNDEDGNCIAKGKLKTIKVKTSYGGYYNSTLREGKWEFFSVDGAKIAEGMYVVKDNVSYKDGEWKYYNAENAIMMLRTFSMGSTTDSKFLDTGTFSHSSEIIEIIADTLGNLNIKETKGQTVMKYTSALNNSVAGDPYSAAKAAEREASKKVYSRDSDSFFLTRFPNTQATLNVSAWSVIAPNNLINNGNFEAGFDKAAPGHSSQINLMNDAMAISWASSNETPDFYKSLDNCFAGFRVMGVNFEVLRNQLKKPLVAGKTYCLQFKLKLKKENSFGFNGVSAVVNKELKFFKNSEEGRRAGLILQSHPDIVLGCRDQWMTISGSFEAEGGEQYLYISNFSDLSKLKVFKADSFAGDYVDEIYYYIDDVVLIEESDDYRCPCNVKGCELNITTTPVDTVKPTESIYSNPKVGQTLVLRNIQFETAKWTLLPESFDQLDTLVELLLKYPNMVVEISGHTDNRGKPKDNLTLSQNRANAVVAYLIEAGIPAEQMVAKGYGQDSPIDTNDNDKGRLNNRRVEFKILEL